MDHLAVLTSNVLGVNQSPLNSGGTVDDHMQNVFFWMFWTSVVVGVLVAGAILFACIRFRRRSDDEVPRQVHGNNKLEVAWTLTPFVILVALFVISSVNMAYVINPPASEGGNPAVNVTVIGQQFSWTYVYTDSDMQTAQGQALRTSGCPEVPADAPTANCLFVPADSPINVSVVSSDPLPNTQGVNACSVNVAGNDPASIRLKQLMSSGDTLAQAISAEGCGVDHSFYIPTLGGQINAIPGQVNSLWFDARLDSGREATYFGQCTELCGVGHWTMLIEVVALPRAEWVECSQVLWTQACLDKVNPTASKGVAL